MTVNWDLVSDKLQIGKKHVGTAEYVEPPEDSKGYEAAVWLGGVGLKDADIMIVGQSPTRDDAAVKTPFCSKADKMFFTLCEQAGFNLSNTYRTYAVKYASHDNSAPKERDLKLCQNALLTEIDKVKPKVIICLGTVALKAVAGKVHNKYKALSDTRGTPFQVDRLEDVWIVATYHPAFLYRQPELKQDIIDDIKTAAAVCAGSYVDEQKIGEYEVIESNQQFGNFLKKLYAANKAQLLSVDAEWEGEHPGAPGAYLRMIQICGGVDGELTAVVRFYPTLDHDNPPDTSPEAVHPNCANPYVCISMFKTFMDWAKTMRIFGHNIQSDSEWFIHYGFDVREYVSYDTMLFEHLLDNRGPFNLTECTLKYTRMGRYDRYLKEWCASNPEMIRRGYGAIPESIIFPYGAGDVQAAYRIMKKQVPKLREEGILKKRGKYPSLAESVIRLSRHLYEMHSVGMRVNVEYLNEVTAKFEAKKAEQLAKVELAARQLGWEEFNPDSHEQVRAILFNKPNHPEKKGIGLTPIKTTSKPAKNWEWVMAQAPEVQARYNPSTGGDSLKILAPKHPFVQMMWNYRGISQICKNFVRSDCKGGINGNIWPDGRIHANFSLLTSTGRLRSANPNVQNLPKKAEGDLAVVFGDEPVPSIRQVFEAEPGWKIIECDYKQAELFVLAGMSGDQEMLKALYTPGEDLHDKTAIGSFQLTVVNQDGEEIDHEEMLALAASDISAFEKAQKSFIYVDPKGKRMTRDEFKSTIRVSAKAINFGIPYGRGAEAIAIQIKAETGLDVSKEEIQEGLDGWKRTFPDAWDFMEKCGDFAVEHGYIENAWGRKRRFNRASNRGEEGATRREASNHPIQGTVADTMVIAVDKVIEARNAGGYRFNVVNQVHDALILEVPDEEIEAASRILEEGMGGVEIPMKIGPTKLDVDIEVFTRWGDKNH